MLPTLLAQLVLGSLRDQLVAFVGEFGNLRLQRVKRLGLLPQFLLVLAIGELEFFQLQLKHC